MATKKKETWPKVTVGSHSTRTEYEDGRVEFVNDWEALKRDVNEAIREYEESQATSKPSKGAKKHTKKSLAELTKAELVEIGNGFGAELTTKSKKEELIDLVMKAQRKANK